MTAGLRLLPELEHHERCSSCAAAVERAEQLEGDLQGIEREVRGYRQKNAALRRELAEARKSHALRPLAVALFVYWRDRTGKHPRLTVFGDKREKAVLDRLDEMIRAGATPAEAAAKIRKAIDGAVADAFVSDSGKRFDDLELICRDASKLDSFASRAAAAQTARDAERAKPRSLAATFFDAVRAAGHDWPLLTSEGRWTMACPGHEREQVPLSIAVDDGHLRLRCFAGCSPLEVLARLGVEEIEVDGSVTLPIAPPESTVADNDTLDALVHDGEILAVAA